MDTKKLITGVALTGTLIAGTAGVALAAEGSGPVVSGETAEARHPRLRYAARAAGKVVLDTVGGTRQELREFLAGGGTVAGYAEARGSSADAVIDALVESAGGRVDQAVANGRISPERAETIRAKLPDIAAKIVNRTWGGHGQA